MPVTINDNGTATIEKTVVENLSLQAVQNRLSIARNTFVNQQAAADRTKQDIADLEEAETSLLARQTPAPVAPVTQPA